MATPAQCFANAENAKLSTGPKTEEGKTKSAKNGVKHGLFAAYERLAPADSARINLFIDELHAGFPEQTTFYEDIIRQYAIAKWRSELFFRMEASFWESAVAYERAQPESAELIEQYGDDILLGQAIRRDAAGPNAHSKLMRYAARVAKDLHLASDSYNLILPTISFAEAKPISSTKLESAPADPMQTPRNAPCPCGSGMKFKQCCGHGAPAVLCAA